MGTTNFKKANSNTNSHSLKALKSPIKRDGSSTPTPTPTPSLSKSQSTPALPDNQRTCSPPLLSPTKVRSNNKINNNNNNNSNKMPRSQSTSNLNTTNNTTNTPLTQSARNRKLQIATFNKPLMPCPSTWESETVGKLGKGEYHDNYEYLDNAANKATFIKEENEKIMFGKARRKLYELAQFKFGGIGNMFKMFDYDGSGTVSLDEFSRGLKRRNLEPLFSREQQRILFEHIDKDGNEELDVDEFMQFLDEPGPLDSSRSTMSRYGRPPTKKPTTKMHPAVQRVKDMIVDRLVARRRYHKFDDDQKVNSLYLIQAFKQWDTGLSGYLTPDEFCDALGEKHLNLGVSDGDMKMVLDQVSAIFCSTNPIPN